MLFNCDLYASNRKKLITLLNNTLINTNLNTIFSKMNAESINLAFRNINYSSLNNNFIKLQSTSQNFHNDTIHCQTHSNHNFDPLQFHLNPQPHCTSKKLKHEDQTTIDSIRSYIQNSLSSFISKCFDKRYAFLKELAKNTLSE